MVLAGSTGALTGAAPAKAKANYTQRVFDAFPAFPATIRIGDLYVRFPGWDKRMIENALLKLRMLRKIERVQIGLYRLAGACVERPVDGRGGPRVKG